MKICPKCQKAYSDDGLNFCLEDGAVLSPQTSGEVFNSPPATVMMNQPRETFPNQQYSHQTQQTGWDTIPKNQGQRSNNSKSWLFAAGILGALVLVCGGGLIGLIAFLASIKNEPFGNSDYNSETVNANVKNTNSAPDDRKNVTEIDLSNWNKNFSAYGKTDFRDGELIMSSKKDGFYFVLVAPANYKTENATTRVVIRNINNGDNNLGYGLLIHSNPTPLTQDYAFLIDSKNQKYRVVKHQKRNEDEVVGWTNSPSIRTGTQENVLEVRDENDSLNFYINGNYITSIRQTDGYKNGVTGLYVGGLSPIGFSNLEIKR